MIDTTKILPGQEFKNMQELSVALTGQKMPAGKGFADFAFIPRANAGFRPAMVVELKYNKSADTAIKQIKDNRYHGALSGYSDKILLVGISYDAEGKDKKHHTCVIEEVQGTDNE